MLTRPWGKIEVPSPISYSITINQFQKAVRDASGKGTTQKTKVISTLRTVIDDLQRQYERNSGEHKAEADIIAGSEGDFTGFWGYWTNHLFNSDVPPTTIWNPCFSELEHARRLLREGKLAETAMSLITARSELLKATAIYYRWKNGIEGAGTKMQVAIGAVAVH